MYHDGLYMKHIKFCAKCINGLGQVWKVYIFQKNPNGGNILKLTMTNSFKGYLKELVLAHTVPE